MGLLLAPASRLNLKKSIETPVSLQFARLFLPEIFIKTLLRESGEEGIRCFAVSSGRPGLYKKIEKGDEVLFSERATGKFTHYGEVIAKTDNLLFGDALWPIKMNNAWEYIYFLKNIQFVDINKRHFVRALGFAPNYSVPGTIKVKKEQHQKYLSIKNNIDFLGKPLKHQHKQVAEPETQYAVNRKFAENDFMASKTYQENRKFEREAPEPDIPLSSMPFKYKPILQQMHITIDNDQTGISYRDLFGDYLMGAKEIRVKDPYIRYQYQIQNFMEFIDILSNFKKCDESIRLHLTTSADIDYLKYNEKYFQDLVSLCFSLGIVLSYKFDNEIHDRSITINNHWKIILGRGLDIYKKSEQMINIWQPQGIRKCKPCEITIIRI